MSNNNQCSCKEPVFLEWENQWEPGEQCHHCQEQEYIKSMEKEEELSPLMQRLIFEKELEYAFKLEERAELKEKLKQIDLEDLPF
jgi:hypothetical protein